MTGHRPAGDSIRSQTETRGAPPGDCGSGQGTPPERGDRASAPADTITSAKTDTGVKTTTGPTPAESKRGVVCHLIASNFAGGPEKQIIELSKRLPAHGWDVVIGSFREGRPSVEIIENAKACDIPTFLIQTRSPYSLAAVSQLRRHLARFGADILITHGYKPNLVGWLAAKRPVRSEAQPNQGRHHTGPKRVIQAAVVRGYTAENRKVRTYETLDRWVLKKLEHVICVSHATKRLMAGQGVKDERLEVIHNAVDCGPERGTGYEAPYQPVDLHAEFALPADAQVVVAAGRLSIEKGHRYLVEAMRQLKDREPRVHAVILGSGVEQERLGKQIAEAGLEDRAILAGFRTPALGYLAGADLVVNPSLTEGLPNVVLEAMAAGTPVVATDVGGVGELIEDGKSGWLVPSESPSLLAEAIAGALAESERAHHVAAAAGEKVRHCFSFQSQADSVSRLLTSWCRPDGLPRAAHRPIASQRPAHGGPAAHDAQGTQASAGNRQAHCKGLA